MLRRVGKRVGASALAAAERDLVSAARYLRLERLAGLVTRTEERLDAEHRDALAQERRERRFLRIGESADGMVTINGRLDPENGAPLVAAMQAMVNQNFRLRKRMQDAAKAGESVIVDARTPEQVRADAMGDFARHLLGCEVSVLPRTGVTLVVRTGLKELREGLGGASVDGHAASLDAGALRRTAASAGVIPQVLGGKSEVLDQGVRARLFTTEQKAALVERDGGCAMCGAPPSWCDAHHIVHWARGGATDLANGVMLCVRCHHDVHRAGWQIHATASEVWFTPPAEVDPTRRRRPGGRRLFDAYPLEPEIPLEREVPLGEPPPGSTSRRGGACPLVSRDACVSMRVDNLDDDRLRDTPDGDPMGAGGDWDGMGAHDAVTPKPRLLVPRDRRSANPRSASPPQRTPTRRGRSPAGRWTATRWGSSPAQRRAPARRRARVLRGRT
ncbi:DUF222 domain-containing protein [Demequina litorisediminis]|uniref:HNH nuclease domain-containing protein n=1 Tax=Demequina litorisediminis TaxID=1849022 RepID=A0ABQ6IGG3_9MICO|nr:DUF222 domain-containing protein [Demequina litorisediminis]GMA36953.1 hypothetical protein GCM10025876_31570 [Demequina litorisediminis]